MIQNKHVDWGTALWLDRTKIGIQQGEKSAAFGEQHCWDDFIEDITIKQDK